MVVAYCTVATSIDRVAPGQRDCAVWHGRPSPQLQNLAGPMGLPYSQKGECEGRCSAQGTTRPRRVTLRKEYAWLPPDPGSQAAGPTRRPQTGTSGFPDGSTLGISPDIDQLTKGMANRRPRVRQLAPSAGLSAVLHALAGPLYESTGNASLAALTKKTLFVIAVASA
ncbi:hypothetical protein BSL78_05527 [Apostichopus japonicus]|uniref:Uncharacterized protein n=1 Tax=Stichopus japonicus TaxID=307972 RepID=A0A2G8LBA8_STIJA|nr:hypothetical protein BSL78_05527 [Apostichopus japonicus]